MKKSFLFMFSLMVAAGLFAQDAEVVAPATPENDAAAVAEAEPPAPVSNDDDDDNGWIISAGISYRNFDNPKMKTLSSASFSEYVLNVGDNSYYSPTEDALRSAIGAKFSADPEYQAFVNGTNPFGFGFANPKYLTFGSFKSVVRGDKGSYSDREECAPILGFEKGFWKNENKNVTLGVVGNFQYFSMDSGFAGKSNSTASSQVGYQSFLSPSGASYIKNYSTTSNEQGVVPVSSAADFDMDLYVFDLGVKLGYEFKSGICGFVAAGPTLTLADIDSKSSISVQTGSGKFARCDKDDDNEFNWGVYATVGASYWFNDSIGLSGEFRFDRNCGDVGTRYVTQDLDTCGGILKVQYRF